LAIKTFNALKQAGKPHPEATLIAWLDKKPMDIAPRLALAEQYQRQGDRKNAIAQYELVTKASSNPAVLNNLAWRYYEANDARAAEVARRAYVADPHRPEIADTYGWILTEQGKVADGLKILEAAQLAAPNSQEIHYHYAAALAKSGKTQEAAMALRQILQGSTTFPSRSDAEALLKTLT
jgi:tetratricopeptide (TPR) repeat protein